MTEPGGAWAGPAAEKIAESLKWGYDAGRRLLGEGFSISIFSGSDRVGFTERSSPDKPPRVWVSIQPILDGSEEGPQVFRGVILHEIGHHLFPKMGERDNAELEAFSGSDPTLWNLVNVLHDEHLERNLRSVNRDWGDILHQAAAYLIKRRIEIVDTGKGEDLMKAVDIFYDPGLGPNLRPFQQFFLALRLGLEPAPHTAPRVKKAIKLVDAGFRRLGHGGLVALAKSLKDLLFDPGEVWGIQPWDKSLILADPDEFRERYGSDFASALGDALRRDGTSAGPGWGNIIDCGRVDPARMRRIPFDRKEYASLASEIRGEASALRRRILARFRSLAAEDGCLSGSRVDVAAARMLALKKNPRVLIREEDASRPSISIVHLLQSTGHEEHHSEGCRKMRLLAAFASEVFKDMPGVDARFFGHDACQVFDLGPAGRCHLDCTLNLGLPKTAERVPEVGDFARDLVRRSGKRRRIVCHFGIPPQYPGTCGYCADHRWIPVRCRLDSRSGRILDIMLRKPDHVFLSLTFECKSHPRAHPGAWCLDFTGIPGKEAVARYSRLIERAVLFGEMPPGHRVRRAPR